MTMKMQVRINSVYALPPCLALSIYGWTLGVRSLKDSWVWHRCCSPGNRSNAENKLHRLKMSYLILVASVNKIIEEPWMLDLHLWGGQKHANTVLPYDHWQSSILEGTSSFPPLYKIWLKFPGYADVIMYWWHHMQSESVTQWRHTRKYQEMKVCNMLNTIW